MPRSASVGFSSQSSWFNPICLIFSGCQSLKGPFHFLLPASQGQETSCNGAVPSQHSCSGLAYLALSLSASSSSSLSFTFSILIPTFLDVRASSTFLLPLHGESRQWLHPRAADQMLQMCLMSSFSLSLNCSQSGLKKKTFLASVL